MKNKLILLVASLITMTGCADPVIGNWENEENDSRYSESLTVEDDGTGVRVQEIHGIVAGGPLAGADINVELEFDIEWEMSNDNEYDIELDCSEASVKILGETFAKGCRDVGGFMDWRLDNLEAECKLNDDGDELKCLPDGGDDKIKYERTH